MKYILDTSAYSAFNRGDASLRPWLQAKHDILVPLIVVGELRAGFAAGTNRQENEQLLRRFLDAPNVTVTTITDKTTEIFANVYLGLRQTGKPIGTNDMWIAAIAIEQSAPLLTTDKDFNHIVDLRLVPKS